MKKINSFFLALIIAVSIFTLFSCESVRKIPESFENAEAVIDFMLEGNELYVKANQNSGNISSEIRKDTKENGQHPYATVITCSDSRVPPEHIFSAGLGELFVIRTAGNVIGDFELGSVEYGAEHLGTQLVLVLGHTSCGAVDATLNGGAHGNIEKITNEIMEGLGDCTDPREAEILNVRHSIAEIMESPIMAELVESGKVVIKGAIYNIETGKVEILD